MENIKKTFSRIGLSYITINIIGLLLLFIFTISMTRTMPQMASNKSLLLGLSVFTQFIIPLPILYFLLKKIKTTHISKKSLSLKTFLIYICITLALMNIGSFIGSGITEIIGIFKVNDIANPLANFVTNDTLWASLIVTSIITPIVEELFFRKLLIDRTIKYGAGISILISALMFGLYHANLNQLIYSLLVGGFFAAVYVKTGNVIYTILLHMAANFTGSIVTTSINNLIASTGNIVNFVYYGIVIVLILIAVYYLYMWRGKYKGLKNNIQKEIKPSLLNVGMVLYIIYFAIFIISSVV